VADWHVVRERRPPHRVAARHLTPEQQENTVQTLGYLDAGTGSLIASVIVGGVAGIAAVFKTFGRNIVAMFSPSKRAALKAEREAAAAAAAADAG